MRKPQEVIDEIMKIRALQKEGDDSAYLHAAHETLMWALDERLQVNPALWFGSNRRKVS